MRRIGPIAAIFATVLSIAAASAGDSWHANVRNCTWCHGTSGQGFTTAPRLAGQQPQYIASQLLSFRAHTRDNPFSQQYMWNAAATLDAVEIRDLAAYFASIAPRPARDGNTALATLGRSIYEQGIPEANVAACLVCHGPNAEGVRDIPRLGGLSHDYLKQRLEQWGQGYHSLPTPMPYVATTLSKDQIEALASYLSFVR
jgi:cytochrome c553